MQRKKLAENQKTCKALIDIQFDRAARWLNNHSKKDWPPPSHIAEKIWLHREHLTSHLRPHLE